MKMPSFFKSIQAPFKGKMEAFWTRIMAAKMVRGQIWAILPITVEKFYQN